MQQLDLPAGLQWDVDFTGCKVLTFLQSERNPQTVANKPITVLLNLLNGIQKRCFKNKSDYTRGRSIIREFSWGFVFHS